MLRSAQDYASVISPEPWQILGVVLKPLSLHHCLLMQRFGVAFISKTEVTATMADLITAVVICSRHWKEGECEEYLHSKEGLFEVEKFGHQVMREFRPKLRKSRPRNKKETELQFLARFNREILKRIALFKEYADEHSAEPAYWNTSSGEGEQSGANWTQCILLVLTGQCGYTREEALKCPLPQALSDYFRYAETQGSIKLATAQDFALMKGEIPT
jgi:hypothetical protein